jgi:hypothetical protein
MNAKLLFVSTVALALASTFAMADDTRTLTRAQVVAEYQHSAADGSLHRTDYDFDAHEYGKASTQTREKVLADMASSRKANTLLGPLRNRTYNPYGMDVQHPSTMTRDEVKTSVVEAMRDGTLRRSDYDGVPVTVARRAARTRTAAPVLADATLRTAN